MILGDICTNKDGVKKIIILNAVLCNRETKVLLCELNHLQANISIRFFHFESYTYIVHVFKKFKPGWEIIFQNLIMQTPVSKKYILPILPVSAEVVEVCNCVATMLHCN